MCSLLRVVRIPRLLPRLVRHRRLVLLLVLVLVLVVR
jgi:hypothetical protein